MLDRKNERRLEKILGSPDGKQTGEGGEAGQGVSAAAPVKAAVLGGAARRGINRHWWSGWR